MIVDRPATLRAKAVLFIITHSLTAGNFFLRVLKFILYKQNKKPSNILIFRTGSIGDSICAVPAILSIRNSYPSATIDVLTNTGAAGLIGFGQILDRKIYHQLIDYLGYSKFQLIKMLRKNKYDLIIQLPQVNSSLPRLIRDMLLFRLVSRSGFGWNLSYINWFPRTQIRHFNFPTETERLLQLVKQETHHNMDLKWSFMQTSEEDRQITEKILIGAGLNPQKKSIGIVIGAKYIRNRWPVGYFHEAVLHFSTTHNVLLIGSKEDEILGISLLAIKGIVNLYGKLSPIQSGVAMASCELVISNDTGPMHLSYAFGTPVVALFSGMNQIGQWYPPAISQSISLRTKNVTCEGCFGKICNDNICMQMISPEKVIQSATAILHQREKDPSMFYN